MNAPAPLSSLPDPPSLNELPISELDLTQFSHLLAHTERLATLGTLTAGVAHELSNPVSVIINTAHTLRAELQAGAVSTVQLQQFADVLEENAWRCIRLIQSLRSYSYQQPTRRNNTHPQKIVENAISLVQHRFRDRNLSLQLEMPAKLPAVFWDENQITQVLVILLLNACDATAGEEKENKITLQARLDQEGSGIIFSVIDDGPGVPPALSTRIFEPFFTTKPRGEGTGLGLSIAAGIVQYHEGTIQFSAVPGGGACFTIYLPIGFLPSGNDTR
jgi:two-component system NtrC family sensor kinase